MRRVVSSSIISVIILLLLAGAIFYFQYFKRSESNVISSVPADVSWLISCSPQSGQLSQLASSAFFTGHDSIEPLHSWYKGLVMVDSLVRTATAWQEIFKEERLYVSGHVTGPSSFGLLFYCKTSGQRSEPELNKLIAQMLAVDPAATIRKNFEGAEIYQAGQAKNVFCWTFSRGILIGSRTPYLVEDALRRQRSKDSDENLSALSTYLPGPDDKLLVAIRYSGFHKWVNTQLGSDFQNQINPLQRIGEWTIGRIEVKRSILKMEGVTTLSDSSQFLSVFKEQSAVEVDLPAVLSRRTAAFVSWRFSDTESFLEAQERLMKKRGDRESGSAVLRQSLLPFFSSWMKGHLSLVYTQSGTLQSDAGFYAVFGIRDSLSCLKMIEALQKKYQAGSKAVDYENYNGYRIGLVNGTAILPSAFGPLFNKMNRFYFAIAGSNLIVANQASTLRAYLNDLKTGSVLAKEEAFASMSQELPTKNNLLFYTHIPESETIFRSVASPSWTAWLAKYSSTLKSWNGLLVSIAQKDGIFQTHAVLSHSGKHKARSSVLWSYSLPATPVYGPAVADQNYPMWFVQDSTLVLHALKADGTQAWERKLESAIQGDIARVELYRPGSYQLAFTTKDFLYVVDSVGLNQGNFPLRLPAPTQTGLGVSAKSGGEQTAFYVACKNLQLYAYRSDGRPLAGFQASRLPSAARQAPLILAEAQGEIWLSLDDGTSLWLTALGKFKSRLKVSAPPGQLYASRSGDSRIWLGPEGKIISTDSSGNNRPLNELGSDSVLNFIPVDLNGDLVEDYVFSHRGGIKAVTGEGINLFSKKQGELNNKVLTSLLVDDKRYFLYDDSNRGEIYLMEENGKAAEGFPMKGYAPLIVWQGGFLYSSDSLSWSFCRYQ